MRTDRFSGEAFAHGACGEPLQTRLWADIFPGNLILIRGLEMNNTGKQERLKTSRNRDD